MCDGSHKSAEAAVVAAQLEDLLDDCAILAFKFANGRRGRNDVRTFFDVDAETSIRVGLGRSGYSPMETHERHRNSTSRQLDTFRHFGHNSDFGVFVSVARHQENMLVAADVRCQCDGHSRKNDNVIQRNQRKSCHSTNDMHIVDDVNY